MARPDWHVYVIVGRDGEVKVGTSADPSARARALSMPTVAYISEPTPDAFAIEAIAHQTLRTGGHWLHGELFSCTPDVAVDAVSAAAAVVASGHRQQGELFSSTPHGAIDAVSAAAAVVASDVLPRRPPAKGGRPRKGREKNRPVVLGFRVSRDLDAAVRSLAAARGQPIGDVAVDLLQEGLAAYFKRHGITSEKPGPREHVALAALPGRGTNRVR